MLLFQIVYTICAIWLAVYGLNSLALTAIYWFTKDRPPEAPQPPASSEKRGNPLAPDPWPSVTVQLPIYNERHVVERLIATVARLDYAADKLQIQVLDDSTDDTQRIARRAVERCRQRGLDIEYIHRRNRIGFKAGALAKGMESAKGELLAIFDADFLPGRDFLKRTVPYFADPRLGCLQTRFEHLNRDYSLLTQAQALFIDGHFIIEQTARNRGRFFINFNGSAGLWRKACIESAGGWRGDTLTEDLDLSYRAQLAGWRFLFLPDVTVPAELPVQIEALKSQRFRWAKGSIQTAKKLLPTLLRSNRPLRVKVEGAIHLTNYLVSPLMLMILLFILPVSLSFNPWFQVMPLLLITAAGPPLLLVAAQQNGRRSWWDRLRSLFFVSLLGTGISLNNTKAVVEAILGIDSGFHRTPKFNIRRRDDSWKGRRYSLSHSHSVWLELLMAGYATMISLLALRLGHWAMIPWLILYALGYGYVAGVSLYQSRMRESRLRRAFGLRTSASSVEPLGPKAQPSRQRAALDALQKQFKKADSPNPGEGGGQRFEGLAHPTAEQEPP